MANRIIVFCIVIFVCCLVFEINALPPKTSQPAVKTTKENWRALEKEHELHMHPVNTKEKSFVPNNPAELTATFWNEKAQALITRQLQVQPVDKVAKNVILFMGDGMSIPTITAARIYKGQKEGLQGEEGELSFEKFPYGALSKTYCVNSQVADSACSGTAYLCGVKCNKGTIGVTAAVVLDDCAAMNNQQNHVTSIIKWAQDAGKMTGVVTTTRITHASPAATYAHTANRDWESDSDVDSSGADPEVCDDIAEQLVYKEPGRNINVLLGGGSGNFRPDTEEDIDGAHHLGNRKDGKNLVDAWQNDKTSRGLKHKYVWNREELIDVDVDNTDYLLGLFDNSHMEYIVNADPVNDPTLSEMVHTAIRVLEKSTEGYVLFVEGGRIDTAHHDTRAMRALEETLQFEEAIRLADELTSIEDTLIIVTADHAHTMSVSGYAPRGTDILDIAGVSDIDDLPYTTLSYANGPGYKDPNNGDRYDISNDEIKADNYEQLTAVPMDSETHGGDDVAIYARGPQAHLFSSIYEENYIAHLIGYAACIGSGQTKCTQ